ncbi:MAG: hypothetical protein COW01_12400 [Bdellovibrionales bacterium CG12_big_fil_rev_8_21_14_0_65_38_15]|nr:MAG: hypothetical protein COW79_05585 [Bdellovibrionales bacterium CG22_combo_CG10-13_8_21_14_all_38_13]PIQ53945.1 MAG: hypothetical protein COW01_12400 [Bdellovibrionales bacterium CG12_big_fil_rev_8_21_14_0_65_38_15]PIR30985.1 MAG: hypothetical protein COV38_02980 [Bdellovibrionales bacterium CG11_big_fil_rev_8_21_14_0_20_38_13]
MFTVNNIEQIDLKQIQELLNISRTQAYYLKTKQRGMSLLDSMLISQYEPDNELLFYNWQPSELLFWKNIDALQESLKQDDQKMAEHFNISKRRYVYLRASTKSIPWQNCRYFFNKYKFQPVHFFTTEIDIECLSNIIKSPFIKTSFLPSTFDGGGSKMRTLANCFDYIKKELGSKRANSLLYALQITEHSLTFSDKNISIKIFSILHQKLRMYRLEDSFFIKMGEYNKYNKINKNIFEQNIPKKYQSSFQTSFKYFITNLTYKFDINRKYDLLEINENFFRLKINPTEIFIKAFNPESPFSIQETYLYIQGHFNILPTYLGYSEIKNSEMTVNKKGEAQLLGYF